MKPQQTRTKNRLPFNELNPLRFEDLCVELIYRHLQHQDSLLIPKHFGRMGNDGGIDIQVEFLKEGIKQKWTVQCKRFTRLAKSDVDNILTEYVKNNDEKPDCYILIAGCSISRELDTFAIDFAHKNGIKEILLWDATHLETILYAKHKDLLDKYFDIKIDDERKHNIAKVHHRLKLKDKVESVLVPHYADKKIRTDVIIHNAHYDTYPDTSDKPGISPWFRLGYFRPYFRGISFFVAGIAYVKINLISKTWALCEYGAIETEGFLIIKAYRIGNIPYDNIIDFEIIGDEYNYFPSFYCEFNNSGEPYEKIWYEPLDKTVAIKLNDDFTVFGLNRDKIK